MKQICKHPLLLIILWCSIFISFNVQAQIDSFTVSSDSVCQDSCITFINRSTGTIDSIRWFIKGVVLPNPHSDTINVCSLSVGIDTISLYVFDTGKIDTVFHVVTIKPTPHPHVLGSFTAWCCSVPNVYISYQWFYGCCFPTSSVWDTLYNDTSSYVYTPYVMRGYYVIVNSGGCLGHSDTAWVPERVNNINSPNHQIHIYPNPATISLTITSSDKITNVTINNLIGQTMYSDYYNNERVQVDVSGLPAGMYLVRINGTEVRKFMKQ